jgi:hypothetical protein
MFIQVMQAKCSRPDEVRSLAESWQAELGPGATGFLGGTFGVTEEGEFLGVVRFESAEAAAANSGRPEQGAWAEKFATALDGPISYSDYDDVTRFLAGGSDDAGFVQVIRGRTDDVEGAKALMRDPGDLQAMRPEIIGGLFGVTADGDFTETVYFTDESRAREGEQQEPPEHVRAAIEGLLDGASFYDLRSPWFESAT